jgi:hypothetical protein
VLANRQAAAQTMPQETEVPPVKWPGQSAMEAAAPKPHHPADAIIRTKEQVLDAVEFRRASAPSLKGRDTFLPAPLPRREGASQVDPLLTTIAIFDCCTIRTPQSDRDGNAVLGRGKCHVRMARHFDSVASSCLPLVLR